LLPVSFVCLSFSLGYEVLDCFYSPAPETGIAQIDAKGPEQFFRPGFTA
jgi:hypothetical protein